MPIDDATLAALRAEEREAAAAYGQIEAARDKLKREAWEKIQAEFADSLRAGHEKAYAAKQAVREYISANASHPFEGKRIVRTWQEQKSRWNISAGFYEKREFAFVEVCRFETEFADNLSRHSKPDLGRAFLRLPKKDGTPGVRLHRTSMPYDGSLPTGWRLAEDDEK